LLARCIKDRDFALFREVEVTIGARKPMIVGLENYANSANIC
jgi:hypothetical protein